MNTNVNFPAFLGALAFLGACFMLAVATLFLIHSLIVRKARRARIIVLVMLIVVGVYLAAVLGFSFASHEKILARGEEKYFCELDCHLAYSVTNVRQTKTLGDPPNQETAAGVYTVVTIKTHFDETTTGSGRGSGLLYPNSRVLTLVDEKGNKYVAVSRDERAFLFARATSTPMTTPLRPGESYTTDVVFDLPAESKIFTLLINEGEWLTRFIVGHENSPFHYKTRFQL
jgi:hypothetical protein